MEMPSLDALERAQESARGRKTRSPADPWARTVSAADLVAAEQHEPDWIAEPLAAPGAVTVVASPRGLCKTHVVHALAVAVATGGKFCGRDVRAGRVLLIDRDNPRREVRRRLKGWGAADAGERLRVLTRDDAPPLTDARAWATFPFGDYDLVILDSFSASTEGVEERDGGASGKALAPLLDLARRGPAVTVLANTRRDAAAIRGSGVIGDRADIIFEVCDATDLLLDPKKAVWWECLPESGDAAWSTRSQRRRRRDDYRLAFVASKFRIAEEPDPFALEVRFEEGAWSLQDVTDEIESTHAEAKGEAAAERQRRIEAAVQKLAQRVQEAFKAGSSPTKTQAEAVLQELGLSRSVARTVFEEQTGKTWQVIAGTVGPKGGHRPSLVVPPSAPSPEEQGPAAATADRTKPSGAVGSEPGVAADHGAQGRQQPEPSKSLWDKAADDLGLSPPTRAKPPEREPSENAADQWDEL
jgi:hypothetical protein